MMQCWSYLMFKQRIILFCWKLHLNIFKFSPKLSLPFVSLSLITFVELKNISIVFVEQESMWRIEYVHLPNIILFLNYKSICTLETHLPYKCFFLNNKYICTLEIYLKNRNKSVSRPQCWSWHSRFLSLDVHVMFKSNLSIQLELLGRHWSFHLFP